MENTQQQTGTNATQWEIKKATYMLQEVQRYFNPNVKPNMETILAEHERISVKLDTIDGILGNIFELTGQE